MTRRGLAGLLALALGVQASPAYALRAPQAQQAGMEELRRRLTGLEEEDHARGMILSILDAARAAVYA